MFTLFDMLLLFLAFLICGAGLRRHWSAWRQGRNESRGHDFAGLVSSLVGQGRIFRRQGIGAAHLILFWGLIFNFLVVLLAQFGVTLPLPGARALALAGDMLGLAMLASAAFFLVRRLQKPRRTTPGEALLPLAVLVCIILTGFAAEGARLAIVPGNAPWWTPVGTALSLVSPVSPLYMFLMIRFHFLAVVLLVAILPFTLLRHLVAAPFNIYYKNSRPLAALKPVPLAHRAPGAGTYADFTWKQLLDVEACTMCGRCEESCPATAAKKPLSPHKIIRTIYDQVHACSDKNGTGIRSTLPFLADGITADELWSCTTCGRCNYECPSHLDIVEKIIDLRRFRIESGESPDLAAAALEGIAHRGNPWALPPTDRLAWADSTKAPLVTSSAHVEMLFWVSCAGAYDPQAQEISRSMVALLNKAGVRYAVLGPEERCCGDPARRLGEEGLFQQIALHNIALFREYGIKKLMVCCPHCFHVFKNEYPLLGGSFEVFHHTQVLAKLIADKAAPAGQPPEGAAVYYQDPCYLGRYNESFEDGRTLIKQIPAFRLINAGDGDKACCCGGGGGQMWLDVRAGERIENLRMAQIEAYKPETIATACPYCKIMFETALASRSAKGEKWSPRIKDVAELLAEAR